jgi:hypothetical protein
MDDLRKAAQQALSVLDVGVYQPERVELAIIALRAALEAEPKQEPVRFPDGMSVEDDREFNRQWDVKPLTPQWDVDADWLYSVLRYANKNPDQFCEVADGKITLDESDAQIIIDALNTTTPQADKDGERLFYVFSDTGIDGFTNVDKDRYEYASEVADENGRDEPNQPDEIEGIRRLIDAAMAREGK